MPNLVVAKRFEVGKFLGGGTYGKVYCGMDLTTMKEVAIKLQKNIRECSASFELEIEVYRCLNKKTGFPKLLWKGLMQQKTVMVMEKLGSTLENLCFTYSLKSICMIALQLLDNLETLHLIGYVHNDIKPDNILIGYGAKWDSIYLNDFGRCVQFVKSGLPTGRKIHHGTDLYASIGMHRGAVAGPREDLESLGYMLIKLLTGTLPWAWVRGKNNWERDQKLLKVKKNSKATLCKTLDPVFQSFMSIIWGMDDFSGVSAAVPYDQLRSLWQGLMDRKGFVKDGQFDWAANCCDLSATLCPPPLTRPAMLPLPLLRPPISPTSTTLPPPAALTVEAVHQFPPIALPAQHLQQLDQEREESASSESAPTSLLSPAHSTALTKEGVMIQCTSPPSVEVVRAEQCGRRGPTPAGECGSTALSTVRALRDKTSLRARLNRATSLNREALRPTVVPAKVDLLLECLNTKEA